MTNHIVGDGQQQASSVPHSVSEDYEDLYFSYAHPTDPWLRRMSIRAVEYFSGAPLLEAKYRENRLHPRPGESFFEACVRLLELNVRYDHEQLEAVPRDRALLVISNHPYGVLDGIIISYLVEKVRPDFKVMANSLLFRAEEPRPFILPVDLTRDSTATETNLHSRALASDHLRAGKTLVIFPGAGISTAPKTFGPAHDLPWKPFTGKLIQVHRLDVLPIFFEGQNSPLFQFVSKFSMTVRQALLFREVVQRIGTDIVVRVGDVIPYDELERFRDRPELLRFLRRKTYALGGRFSPNDPDDRQLEDAYWRGPKKTPRTIRKMAATLR